MFIICFPLFISVIIRWEISLVRSFTKVPRVETLVSLGRNKSFSSVELMQLLRDIIFVLWRTLLAEKVDTFERHIHKKGCLEYCLFMYSVAFFQSEIRKSPPLNSHRFTKNRSKSVILLQKGQKNMFYNMLVLQTLIKSSQKNFKKKWQKSLERNKKESTFASAFDKESHS